MDKRIKPNDMVALTRLYHRAGFLVHGMFIFGYPMPDGVTMKMSIAERVRQFKQFIRKSRLDTLQVLLPVPLPGTALTERLTAACRIFPRADIGWEYYDGNFPVFMPDEPLTPEDMQAAVRQLMRRLLPFPISVRHRAQRHDFSGDDFITMEHPIWLAQVVPPLAQ